VLRLALLTGIVIAAATVAGFLLLGGDDGPSFDPVAVDSGPFAYTPEREAELTERAAAGHSHVIYAKSPGGVAATARRMERYRPKIEEVAEEAGVDPDLVEAMVFLESAGLPEVTASDDVEGAAGLTQILAGTATELLGMRVDVEESRRLTRAIRRAERRGEPQRERRLRARRRVVDERFDPDKALEGTGRYLSTALDSLGRDDLAVVSYHMGIGNLQDVLSAYGEDEASYARVYFDSTPDRHPRTYALLNGLGDDSKTYLWRVLASQRIMELHRGDPAELERLDRLHAAKASAEEVLHPRTTTNVFEDPDDLEAAYDSGDLRPFPNDPARYGLRRDRRMGELARRLDEDPELYRGLRPEALAAAVYIGQQVRELAGSRSSLIVTSTVRDQTYQDALARRNPEATRAYSLHTTGFAFDVRRRYRSERQARAFQYLLDRLQSLNLIAWVREPGAIHITASSEARRLLAESG
jgi:Family of unknown function (DUF5715)/Transglycosylase SLT domain